jgi:hypothetical protein
MFKLTNLTNTLYENIYQGVPVALINNSTNGVPISQIQLSPNNIYDNPITDVVLVDTEYNVGDEIIVDLDGNLTGVNNVVIGGVIYTYNNDNIPGTFYYNSSTNQLTVRPNTTIYPNTFISVHGTYISGLDDVIKNYNYNNLIKIDRFYTSSGNLIDYFNIKDTVTVNQNYNDYPTTSLNLVVNNSAISVVRNIIKDTSKRWVIANIPFRVQSYTETIAKQEQYPAGNIEINLTFEGWYKRLLDKSVYIRKDVTLQESDCTALSSDKRNKILLNSETIDPNNNLNFIVSLKTLASRAGVALIGEDINVSYPLDTPGNATTTLSSAISTVLSQRPDMYVLYSKLNGVHIVKWKNPKSHSTISESTIISELQNGYNLDSNIKYIYPTYLTYNYTNKQQDNNEENTKRNKPEYESIKYKITTTEEGDEDYNIPYVDTIDSLTYNYDVGGRTKTRIVNTFYGNDITRTVSETWGFVFNSDQIGNFDDNGVFRMGAEAIPYWRIVEYKDTEYVYDDTSRYLLGTLTTGYKYLRYKQETDEECQVAFLKDEGGDALKEVFIYTWFREYLTEGTTYKLAQLNDFYESEVNPEDQYLLYTYCDYFGKENIGYVLNPNFVYPRFAIETENYYNCYSEREHPLNAVLEAGDIQYPKLKTGEFKRTVQKLKIKKTTKSRDVSVGLSDYFYGEDVSNLKILNSDKSVEKEYYTVFETKQQSGDSDFKNNTENTTLSVNEGRPSEHTKGSPKYKLKEDGTVENKEQSKNDVENNPYEYIVYTTPYTGNEQVNSTKYYNVSTLNKAKEYFTIEYEKSLFNNTANNSLVCLYRDNIFEGELISYNYNNEFVSNFRIKSITKTFNLKGSGLITGFISFNGNSNYLNSANKLTIQTLARLKKKANPNIEVPILLPPYYRDSILSL